MIARSESRGGVSRRELWCKEKGWKRRSKREEERVRGKKEYHQSKRRGVPHKSTPTSSRLTRLGYHLLSLVRHR
jgi:hypothetical protein